MRPNRHYQTHLPFLAVLIAMAGCATMADVRPGHGRITEISGFTYEQVWAAAVPSTYSSDRPHAARRRYS